MMDSTVQHYRPNQQRVKRIVGTTYLRKVITEVGKSLKSMTSN